MARLMLLDSLHCERKSLQILFRWLSDAMTDLDITVEKRSSFASHFLLVLLGAGRSQDRQSC